MWGMHRRRGLRMWVLSLLARGPKNGAEIMNAIEEMSQGWWRPSPGSIYPLLDSLVQEGLIAKRDDGRYELSPTGRQAMEMPWGPWGPWGLRGPQAPGVDGVLGEMNGYVSYLEDVARSDRAGIDRNRERIKSLADRMSALIKK
jgi:DNA-binding PadR family transcriptional regulator